MEPKEVSHFAESLTTFPQQVSEMELFPQTKEDSHFASILKAKR